MKLQKIKTSQAYESATNPRGKDFKGKSFDDLVESIKEKGVLVPIFVRPKKQGDKLYEVVAGNRRFRASQIAGLKEIPARIEDIDDTEAREVQIIENLQREDVHPLEEGESYRQLIEKSKCDVKTIAIKVGKSESYVRQRLFLTNLVSKVAKFYRKGKINDGHAVLIAKLSPNDQIEAYKYINEEWDIPTVSELKDWIKETFYDSLDFQPWLKSKKLEEAVGKCKECPPNNATLFGDVKEGACTSLKCWNRKMNKYIECQVEEMKASNIEVVKVSTDYGEVEKGILGRGQYEPLGNKAKDHCDYATKAIIAVGVNRGTKIWVCASKDCEKHSSTISSPSYKLTKEEKGERRKVRLAEVAKAKRENVKFLKTIENVKWPVTKDMLDVVLEMLLADNGEIVLRTIGKRHEWEALRTKDKYRPKGYIDWGKTVNEKIKEMTVDQKLQLAFEMMLENVMDTKKKKFLKTINK